MLIGAAAMFAGVTTDAAAQAVPQPAQGCEVHIYPADGPHSVGEDFDAVHRVDQDLRHYYEMAGRPLNWLTPARQLELLHDTQVGDLVGVPVAASTLHPDPLSRHQALEPGQREPGTGCVVEVMLPQIMLERGGLAARSLRLFGIVRRYDGGVLTRSYSGFGTGPMTGFQLKSPADADAATAMVERAYQAAAEMLLRNSAKPPRK